MRLLNFHLDAFPELQDLPGPGIPKPAPGTALLDDVEKEEMDIFFKEFVGPDLPSDDVKHGKEYELDVFFKNYGGLTDERENTIHPMLQPPYGIWINDARDGSSTSNTSPDAYTADPIYQLANSAYGSGHVSSWPAELSEVNRTAPASPEAISAASTLIQSSNSHSIIGIPNLYGTATTERTSSCSSDFYSSTPDPSSGHALKFDEKGKSHTRRRTHFFNHIGPVSKPTYVTDPFNLRWGSDANFDEHGFVAPPHQETVEEVTDSHLGNLKCLEPQPSAANTQPSSPVLIKRSSCVLEAVGDIDASSQKIKRRNTRSTSGQNFVLPRKTTPSSESRRTTKQAGIPVMMSEVTKDAKVCRRKSATTSFEDQSISPLDDKEDSRAPFKSGRDNLSEEQKRSNHIHSEQKRRDLIKQGFHEICELVPSLKDGGSSKSQKLMLAADWLEELVRGNMELKARLRRTKAPG